MVDKYEPMADLESAHKLTFHNCTIIPRDVDEPFPEVDGVLSFEGYAIVPKTLWKEVIDTLKDCSHTGEMEALIARCEGEAAVEDENDSNQTL